MEAAPRHVFDERTAAQEIVLDRSASGLPGRERSVPPDAFGLRGSRDQIDAISAAICCINAGSRYTLAGRMSC
jgi:hypothetical protein